LQLRAQEPLLRHPRWLVGTAKAARDAQVNWLTPSGHAMQGHDWHSGSQRAFVAEFKCGANRRRLALLFNPEAESLPFTLVHGPWVLLLDSSGVLAEGALASGQPLQLAAHSLVLLGSTESGASSA
jgi:pullulanase/glycogen debranching enzyme